MERKYIQEQQPNQFHCYNQNMGFVKKWTRTWPITGLESGGKDDVVDVAFQGAWLL